MAPLTNELDKSLAVFWNVTGCPLVNPLYNAILSPAINKIMRVTCVPAEDNRSGATPDT